MAFLQWINKSLIAKLRLFICILSHCSAISPSTMRCATCVRFGRQTICSPAGRARGSSTTAVCGRWVTWVLKPCRKWERRPTPPLAGAAITVWVPSSWIHTHSVTYRHIYKHISSDWLCSCFQVITVNVFQSVARICSAGMSGLFIFICEAVLKEQFTQKLLWSDCHGCSQSLREID